MLSKSANNKKCAPKLIFFNEKKMGEIPIIFDIDNWLRKSNFGTFWHLPINPIHKIQSFPLSLLIFFNLSNLYIPLKNSITRIAIMKGAHWKLFYHKYYRDSSWIICKPFKWSWIPDHRISQKNVKVN